MCFCKPQESTPLVGVGGDQLCKEEAEVALVPKGLSPRDLDDGQGAVLVVQGLMVGLQELAKKYLVRAVGDLFSCCERDPNKSTDGKTWGNSRAIQNMFSCFILAKLPVKPRVQQPEQLVGSEHV